MPMETQNKHVRNIRKKNASAQQFEETVLCAQSMVVLYLCPFGR